MAEELVKSWAEQEFFDSQLRAIKGFRAIITEMEALNAAAKKIEGFAAQASTIKEVVTNQNALVDANGKLINNYNSLNGKYKEAMALMAVQNGHSKETVQVQREIIKLKNEEERIAKKSTASKAAETKAIKDITDERKLLNLALRDQEVRYANLFLTQGKNNKLTIEAKQRVLELRKTLDEVNQSIGRYGDNVGNYQGKFNSLGNAVQQVGRELPNFAISARTGFQALTNNLPILADELARVKAANAALRAEGKPTTSVFKQLASAVFNWQTLLVVGITLITAYADEIGDFFSELFSGKKAVDSMKLSVEQLNKAYEAPELAQAVSDVNELRVNIQLAKEGILDKKKVLHQYNETLGKTTGEVNSLEAAEKALIKNGDAYIKMTLYKAAAQIAFQDAAKKAIELEKTRAESEFETINAFEKIASVVAGGGIDPKVLQKRKAEKEAALEKDLKAQEGIAAKFQKRAADLSKQFNFDIFGGSQDEKTKKVKDTSAKDARDRQKAIDEETERTLRSTKGMYEKRLAIAKDAVENEKLTLKERLTNVDKALLDEVSIVQINGAIQHKTREEIEADITELVLKYNRLRTDIVDKATKEQARLEKDNLEGVAKAAGNAQKQSRKEFEDEQKARFDTLSNYTNMGIDFAQSLGQVNSAITRKRIKEIDEEIDAINKKRDAEIDSINASQLSAEEKEKKIADAKALADAKTQQLERDKEARAKRAAQVEKGITIAQIIASTALAVVRALGAAPYTPANIALAAATGAVGAAQLAVAIATPAYEEGTQGVPHPGGPARLFEGNKKEAVVEPDGRVWVGSTEGVYNLSKGAEVISNKELLELSKHYTLGLPMRVAAQNSGLNTERLEKGLDALKSAIENKPVAQLNVTGLGMQRLSKQANQITEYIKSFSC